MIASMAISLSGGGSSSQSNAILDTGIPARSRRSNSKIPQGTGETLFRSAIASCSRERRWERTEQIISISEPENSLIQSFCGRGDAR